MAYTVGEADHQDPRLTLEQASAGADPLPDRQDEYGGRVQQEEE